MPMAKSRASVPVAVEETYALWLWFDNHVTNLPAHARAATGARVLTAAIDAMDALLCAAYEPRGSDARVAYLRTANQRIALLRYLTRGMRERRQLSLEQHAHVATKLDAIGKMIGAWQKSLAAAT
jgi:hypothetical protein